jgi:predicted nuclease of restriction endonuclease-like RecB superfamily
MKFKNKTEMLIREVESRIAHHKRYREQLIEEALKLSSSNPRQEELLTAAKRFAMAIENSQADLYKLYAQRAGANA